MPRWLGGDPEQPEQREVPNRQACWPAAACLSLARLQSRSISFKQFQEALPLLATARGCDVQEVSWVGKRPAKVGRCWKACRDVEKRSTGMWCC